VNLLLWWHPCLKEKQKKTTDYELIRFIIKKSTLFSIPTSGSLTLVVVLKGGMPRSVVVTLSCCQQNLFINESNRLGLLPWRSEVQTQSKPRREEEPVYLGSSSVPKLPSNLLGRIKKKKIKK